METQQQPNMGQGSNPHENFLKEMEIFFEKYLYKNAPYHLPPETKEWIVKYSPWIDLLLLIISAPIILAAFSLNLFFLPFATFLNPFHSVTGIIHWLIVLASFVIQIIALPGLFSRSIKSWYLVYYSILLGAVGSLIGRDIFGLILGTAISLYILFQVKEKYH
jgi:hypothetical protein